MKPIKVAAESKSVSLGLKEVILYKDLLLALTYKDLRVRYAQTFLGILWVVIQPLIALIILWLIFGKVAKIDTNSIPYPLFAIPGVSLWIYFAFVVGQSGSSIISAQEMIKKIYFPKLILPVSKSLVGMVDLIVGFAFIFIVGLYYSDHLKLAIVFIPLIIPILIISSLGVGIWISALSVRYRDFQHIIPFVIQLGFYISPIAFPASMILENAPYWVSILYYLNPMAGLVEEFRWILFGSEISWDLVLVSNGISVVFLITGILFFQKVEKQMADII